MRTPGFGITALLLATPAYATASLSCSANDKSPRFSAEGIVSHGVGETVAQFAGELAGSRTRRRVCASCRSGSSI
jgi:hypothetical protein